jgi:hypothetical protein
MGIVRLGSGVVAVGVLAAVPAWAQWNNEPYSYRSGGSVGMSTAYRQAYIDQQLTGNRPRNLVRAADGSLVTVIEKDRQAFLATPQPNYLINRGGTAAGISIGIGGVALASVVDGWTMPAAVIPSPMGRAPIDSWTAQLDGLRPVQ